MSGRPDGVTVGCQPVCAALGAFAAGASSEGAAGPSEGLPPGAGAPTRGSRIRISSEPSEAEAQEVSRGSFQEEPIVPEATLPDWLAARA